MALSSSSRADSDFARVTVLYAVDVGRRDIWSGPEAQVLQDHNGFGSWRHPMPETAKLDDPLGLGLIIARE